MYWWLKDVLVERTVHHEQQQQHNRKKVRFPLIRKSLLNLKGQVKSGLELLSEKQKVRQSYETLSKLNDHYLRDIGIRRTDLNTISSGNYPARYQQSAITNTHRTACKIVSVSKNKPVPKSDLQGNANDYQKAA